MGKRSSPASTDPLVYEIAKRLRRVDLVGWSRIAGWAERLGLSFEDLRLLLALTMKDGSSSVRQLADLAGLSLDAAYPGIHSLRGRGYLREESRRYSLSEEGRKLVAELDDAHLEGIQAYVDELDPDERDRLRAAFAPAGET